MGAVVAVSSLYETEPIGGPEQGPFLNAVVVVDTDRPPRRLLEAGLGAEGEAGREQRQPWGPRTLDVDVLLYGDAEVDEAGLRIPHPRIAQRRFVLEPLVEAWPEAEIPGVGPAARLLEGVRDQVAEVVAGPEWVLEPGAVSREP